MLLLMPLRIWMVETSMGRGSLLSPQVSLKALTLKVAARGEKDAALKEKMSALTVTDLATGPMSAERKAEGEEATSPKADASNVARKVTEKESAETDLAPENEEVEEAAEVAIAVEEEEDLQTLTQEAQEESITEEEDLTHLLTLTEREDLPREEEADQKTLEERDLTQTLTEERATHPTPETIERDQPADTPPEEAQDTQEMRDPSLPEEPAQKAIMKLLRRRPLRQPIMRAEIESLTRLLQRRLNNSYLIIKHS
jgi:hypothetical protein